MITPTTSTIGQGATSNNTATGNYSDGNTSNISSSVTWVSSNTTVATVDANGLATGLTQGTSYITASLGGKISNSESLTVTAPTITSISITPSAPFVVIGASTNMIAMATYTDNSTANVTSSVTWDSSNTGVATIAASGLATGLTQGTSSITASLGGNTSNAASLTITATNGYTAVTGGCVHDNGTGLMWEVKTTDGGLRDWNKVYTLTYLSVYYNYASDFVTAVNATNLCGHNGWRLPTINELLSIMVSNGVGAPFIDRTWFPNTQTGFPGTTAGKYWTSSPDIQDADYAGFVDFSSCCGYSYDYRSDPLYVRLVRVGQ